MSSSALSSASSPYVEFIDGTKKFANVPTFSHQSETSLHTITTEAVHTSSHQREREHYEKNLRMGPIDKFLTRGKIPWKLILDFLVIAIILVHVLLFSRFRKPFIVSTQDGFLLRFFPEEFQDEDSSRRLGLTESTEGYNTFYFYQTDEAIQWLRTISDRYFSYTRDSPETFVYSGHEPRIRLNLQYEPINFRDYLSNHQEGKHSFESSHNNVHSHPDTSVQQHIDVHDASVDGCTTTSQPCSTCTNTTTVSHNSSPTSSAHSTTPAHIRWRTQQSSSHTRTKRMPTHVDDSLPEAAKIANIKGGIPSIFFLQNMLQYETILTKDDPYGPLQLSNTSIFSDEREFFDHLNKLEINFDVINMDLGLTSDYPECYRWRVHVQFDYINRGTLIPMKIRWSHYECIVHPSFFWNQIIRSPLTYIRIIIILLSLLSLVLNLNHVKHRVKLYRKRNKEHHDRTYKDLFTVYLTPWHWLVITKDVCNMLGYFFFLSSSLLTQISHSLDVAPFLVSGLGIFIAMISVVRYLKFGNPLYFMTIRTLERGVPSLARAIIGVLPVFLGFATCGTMWFGDYSTYFDSIAESCMTLFTVTNGDVVLDSFHMLYAYNWWRSISGRIFIYVYVLLFVAAGWNIFLMIMESIFFAVREAIEEEQKSSKEEEKIEAVHNLYSPPSLQDFQEVLSPANDEKKGEDNVEVSSNSHDDDPPAAERDSEGLLPTMQTAEYPEEITQFQIYADVLCDSIETKLFNRQMGHPTTAQAILLDQLRMWTQEVIAASSVKRKRRRTVHFSSPAHLLDDSDPSPATPTKRRSVSFALMSSHDNNRFSRRRAGSILKTSSNYHKVLNDLELQDMGGWTEDNPTDMIVEENKQDNGEEGSDEEHNEPEDEPFDLLQLEDDDLESGEQDDTAIGADDLIREFGL